MGRTSKGKPSMEGGGGASVRHSFRPLCIALSSPSGGGKTTLCQTLLEVFPGMVSSVSCTTRAPREGEREGRSYYFVAEPEFQRRAVAGFFLEYARVHGHWYGTPRQPIEAALRAGRHVLLAIDVQGVERIRALIARGGAGILSGSFVDVFVMPPSLDELRRRLAGRGQDEPASMERRLAAAQREMDCRDRYRYVVVNDRLEDAVRRLKAIIEAEQKINP